MSEQTIGQRVAKKFIADYLSCVVALNEDQLAPYVDAELTSVCDLISVAVRDRDDTLASLHNVVAARDTWQKMAEKAEADRDEWKKAAVASGRDNKKLAAEVAALRGTDDRARTPREVELNRELDSIIAQLSDLKRLYAARQG